MKNPVHELAHIVKNQKTVRTGRLGKIHKAIAKQIIAKDKIIRRQQMTINMLNTRAQRAEEMLREKGHIRAVVRNRKQKRNTRAKEKP